MQQAWLWWTSQIAVETKHCWTTYWGSSPAQMEGTTTPILMGTVCPVLLDEVVVPQASGSIAVWWWTPPQHQNHLQAIKRASQVLWVFPDLIWNQDARISSYQPAWRFEQPVGSSRVSYHMITRFWQTSKWYTEASQKIRPRSNEADRNHASVLMRVDSRRMTLPFQHLTGQHMPCVNQSRFFIHFHLFFLKLGYMISPRDVDRYSPVMGASWLTMSLPVSFTESSTAVTSHGMSVRRSMTSHEMPCLWDTSSAAYTSMCMCIHRCWLHNYVCCIPMLAPQLAM